MAVAQTAKHLRRSSRRRNERAQSTAAQRAACGACARSAHGSEAAPRSEDVARRPRAPHRTSNHTQDIHVGSSWNKILWRELLAGPACLLSRGPRQRHARERMESKLAINGMTHNRHFTSTRADQPMSGPVCCPACTHKRVQSNGRAGLQLPTQMFPKLLVLLCARCGKCRRAMLDNRDNANDHKRDRHGACAHADNSGQTWRRRASAFTMSPNNSRQTSTNCVCVCAPQKQLHSDRGPAEDAGAPPNSTGCRPMSANALPSKCPCQSGGTAGV